MTLRDHVAPHRPQARRSTRRALLTTGVACLLASAGVRAQQTEPSLPASAASPDSLVGSVASPGGAFLRAVLIPGWGHASIGAHTRGGFYFAAESATAFMIVKTRRRLRSARERTRFRETFLRAELGQEGITDPDEIEAALAADPTLEDLRGLVEAREGQREDWLAFGLFLLFLSGADAFVSAHLADFPAPLSMEGGPTGDGRFEVGVSLRLPLR